MSKRGWNPLSSLVTRCVVYNSSVAATLAFGYFSGPLKPYLIDPTYMTHGIGLLAILTFVWAIIIANSIRRDWANSDEYRLKFNTAIMKNYRTEYKDALAEKFSRRYSWLPVAGYVLVALGLLGTIIGISNGMEGLSPGVATDSAQAEALIIALGGGLTTVFNTTIAGIVGMIWNLVNVQMIKNETSRLFQSILTGEDR